MSSVGSTADEGSDTDSLPDAAAPPRLTALAIWEYLGISALLSLTAWVLLMLPNFLIGRGWSSQRVGWAIGLYFLVHLTAQVFAGPLADRIGHFRTGLVGVQAAFASGLLYVLTFWYPAAVFPARLLHAAGVALITAGVLAQLIHSVPARLRGRVMGYYGVPGFAMMAIGPLLSEWIAHHWGFAAVFVTIPVIVLGVAWLLLRLPRSLAREETSAISLFRALRESLRPLHSVLVFSTCFGLCFSVWSSFLAPAVQGVAGGVSGYGTGYGLGGLLTRLGLSDRLDHGSRRLGSIAGLLLYGVILALIPQARGVKELFALGIVSGMIHGVYYPSLSSIAAERFHPLHTGQAMSLYISASSVGMFVGPPVWGAVSDRFGFPATFQAAGVLLIGGATVFVLHQHRRGKKTGATDAGPAN